MRDPHDQIGALFSRFSEAVAQGDVAAFEALCVEDAPPETELFLHNCEKLRALNARLRLRRIVQEGEVAEVHFDVVDAASRVIDEGKLVCSDEGNGWRIRGL